MNEPATTLEAALAEAEEASRQYAQSAQRLLEALDTLRAILVIEQVKH